MLLVGSDHIFFFPYKCYCCMQNNNPSDTTQQYIKMHEILYN